MEAIVAGVVGFIIIVVFLFIEERQIDERVAKSKKEREELKERINASSKLFVDYSYVVECQKKHLNITGVYVLWNKTTDKYYVGQSKNIIKRVYDHFNGRGNSSVYEDILRDHDFAIRFISLKSSNFWNIDDQESFYIREYDSFYNGYNKNKGNNVGKEMGKYDEFDLIP